MKKFMDKFTAKLCPLMGAGGMGGIGGGMEEDDMHELEELS